MREVRKPILIPTFLPIPYVPISPVSLFLFYPNIRTCNPGWGKTDLPPNDLVTQLWGSGLGDNHKFWGCTNNVPQL